MKFVRKTKRTTSGHQLAIYECQCGHQLEVRVAHVKGGATKRCRDCRLKYKKGDRFGLTVLTGKRKTYGYPQQYEAICSCGEVIWLALAGLTRYAGCKSCRGERARLRQVISGYKQQCKIKKRRWDLTEKQALELFSAPCYYCQALPDPRNGIDRLDNTAGYTLENVVSCCYTCNKAKMAQTVEEFRAWAKRLMPFASNLY